MSVDPAELPALGSDLEFIGPFESHRVLLYGRRVPYLEAHPMNGGMVHLTLDHRYGIDLTIDQAETVVPFIADCIAVASGWACHPREGEQPCRTTPFPRAHSLGPPTSE